MATTYDADEANMVVNLQSSEINVSMRAILDELKSIRCELKRKDEQTRLVSQSVPMPQGQMREERRNPGSIAHVTASNGHSLSVSIEMREGLLLKEAIHRYNNNCVPPYDHDGEPEKPSVAYENILFKEWSSILGNFSHIPNDNRLLFSFQASELNLMSSANVDQFLEQLLTFRETSLSVSDHFDTGLCRMYQFMGETQGSEFQQELPETLSQSHKDWPKTPPLPVDVAPWRRVITLRGLAIGSPEIEDTIKQQADLARCPYFSTRPIRVDVDSRQHKWILDNTLMWRAVDHHLRCARLYEREYSGREWKLSRCVLFHITFWEIMAAKPHESAEKLWRVGKLHSHRDLNRPEFVRNSACTVFAIPCNDTQGIKARTPYWTILWLLPKEGNFTEYRENPNDMKSGRYNEMLHEMGYFVLETLKKVVASWRELALYFDVLVGEGSAFLNPDYHDSLLTDDATFSRSKKYFWAIKFLKEAEVNIADNLKQLQRFVDLVVKTPIAPEQVRLRDKQLNEHRENLQRLEELKADFQDKRAEVVALRDGLFSASAVIESRASTQLGENIKLLTFVSIFFLPLSFVMSVWSINNSIFSLSSLTIVAIIVALSTYLIVLNLNNVVYVSRGTFRSIANYQIDFMVQKMKQDPSAEWQKRGKAFEKFKPDLTIEHKPSDWRLLQYALRLGWQIATPWTSGGKERREGKAANVSTADANSISKPQVESNSSKLQGFKLWRRRQMSQGGPEV